jgi:hypothetical protein
MISLDHASADRLATIARRTLRQPANDDVARHLRHLAEATGRSTAEVLRLLVLRTTVAAQPDVRLERGPAIIRLVGIPVQEGEDP